MSSRGRRQQLEAEGYRAVCHVREVPALMPLRVEIDGHGVLICRMMGGFAAIDERCPHRAASMARGELRRGRIVCPVHLFEFDLHTGACVEGRCAPTVVHRVELDGNAIFVRLADALRSSHASESTDAPAPGTDSVGAGAAAEHPGAVRVDKGLPNGQQ